MKIAILALLVGVAAADEGDDAMGRRVQLLLRAHQTDIFACVGEKPVLGEALLNVVVGDTQPLKVEVLKADADATKAAACVAKSARQWDLSMLRASKGDQVVFPLAWRPAAPDRDAVHATLRVQKLAPGGVAHFSNDLIHAAYLAEGDVGKLRVGDVVYLDELAADITAGKRGATLVIAESPRTTTPTPQRMIHPPVAHPIAGGTARLYLDGTLAPFALDELCVKKGNVVPPHAHDASDELVYIERGHATTTLGPETQKSSPGDVVVIPRGTRHSVEALDDVCFVQVYAPPGPEQRFKAH
jgi:quercetin dioxygenase-like cupin family protein